MIFNPFATIPIEYCYGLAPQPTGIHRNTSPFRIRNTRFFPSRKGVTGSHASSDRQAGVLLQREGNLNKRSDIYQLNADSPAKMKQLQTSTPGYVIMMDSAWLPEAACLYGKEGQKKPANLAVAGKSNSRRVGGDRLHSTALTKIRLLYCCDTTYSLCL